MSQWRKGQKEGMIARLIADGRLPAGIDAARVAVAGIDTPLETKDLKPEGKGRKRRRIPNKTEAAFGRILEAQQTRGEIQRSRFEALAFRWGGTEEDTPMLYSPDWIVTLNSGEILCVEIKGSKVWDRDIVRFKGCRAEWPEYKWEMWQWKHGEWDRIH